MVNGFDIASVEYDSAFTFSNIGKAQRRMVYKYLNPLLNQKEKLSILELNCGTGEDAIQFAKLGHHILATDISEGMIKVAKAKTHSKNLSFKIQDINTIDETSFNRKFDLLFSNFGGLNCLSQIELKTFFYSASQLLHANGKIILVIMPKHCLWEQTYYTLKGDLKNAKRRNTSGRVFANVDGVNVETWYHNPKDIIDLAKSHFNTVKVKPIGLSIPPSYLENSFLSKQPIISVFKALDNTCTSAFWAKYADHYLIELTKK